MDYDALSTGSSMSPIAIIFALAFIVFFIACEWMLFSKAGEPGWKCLIPIYNTYLQFKLFWGNGWLFLLMFVPFANFVVSLILCFKMSKSFGHGVGFGFLIIFLPIIAFPMLAFGSSQYSGPAR